MPHFRVDDALHSHPKARQAGLEAMGLWNLCGSYCMGYLTDGFVPEWYVKSWPKGATLAKRLVACRLWEPAERDGEKGWQFHEFVGPERQDSREKIEADREKWRLKKQKQRTDSPVASPQVSPRDSGGESRENPGYTQPNPTHKENSAGHLLEASHESNAAGGIAATPGADLVRELIPRDHPDAVRTALRIRASELIRAGTPKPDVAAALELWLTKPSLGPNALPSLVSEAVKLRNGHGNGRPSKIRSIAQLAQEVRAEETAQLQAAANHRELT